MNSTINGAENKEVVVISNENEVNDVQVESSEKVTDNVAGSAVETAQTSAEESPAKTSSEARAAVQAAAKSENEMARDNWIRKKMRETLEKSGMSTHEKAIQLVEVEERLKKLRQQSAEGNACHTWKDLEVGRTFTLDDKIKLIDDETVIVGIDIGKETHTLRAFNRYKIELDQKDVLPVTNREEGLENALKWMELKCVKYGFSKIIVGCEPTGHYWLDAAAYFMKNGLSVFLVNPYAVKQLKELDDNSQEKNDWKDPGIIAKLVIDGRYMVPYIPAGQYDALRRIEQLRVEFLEQRTTVLNRLTACVDVNFPELTDVTKDLDGSVNLTILRNMPLPQDILEVGVKGVQQLFRDNKLRGQGMKKAMKYYAAASRSIGTTENPELVRREIRWMTDQIIWLDGVLGELNEEYAKTGLKIENLDKVLAIRGIGMSSLLDMLGEIGDLSRFSNAMQIFKLAGLVPVEQSSGKHKGEAKISKRGRKLLRKHLWTLAKNVCTHSPEWKQLHVYYTTREKNPLTKMQSLMAIAGKLLRVIFTILTKGVTYDPNRLLSDIKRIEPKKNQVEGGVASCQK